EDGIRDFHVTGVQTCALPISRAVEVGAAAGLEHGRGAAGGARAGDGGGARRAAVRVAARLARSDALRQGRAAAARVDRRLERLRSEERRVGKAWRTRGASAHR